MLIYVENKAFPLKTFVTVVLPADKIARIRAQLLHILYELGKEDHQFRLRYKGQFLRDAFTLDDYAIGDNAIVKMVPMSRRPETMVDVQSVSSSMMNFDLGPGQPISVKKALVNEVQIFKRREAVLRNYKTVLLVHFLIMCLSVFTVHWYAFFWLATFLALAAWFVPSYSRVGGYVGNYTHLRFIYCILVGLLSLLCVAVSLYFSLVRWMRIVTYGCDNWVFADDCSHRNVYTAVYFSGHALLLLITSILAWVLLANFRIEVGDLIEKYLVQERDIDQVMQAARTGRLKEKRQAAYELATMAASSDDNKFRIVAEGGLDVLISMALCRDESTQEHAIEALSELLTIPSVQDAFVDMGGVRTMTAVLHSPHPRVMQEAAVALYTIVSESEHNKSAVVADHGLEDLVHAAYQGTIYCQRIVASIFLELAFNTDIRLQLTSRNIPAQGLIHLCQTNDPDTQRFALQTLELMAIESSDVICAQEDLLEVLLDLPFKSLDEKLYLLAGKILLYYAENRQTCEQLLSQDCIKESLFLFARCNDSILQKVVAKIIFCMLETRGLKLMAKGRQLNKILEYILDNAMDRDVWNMADEGLHVMNSEDELAGLPMLSTLEKLSKMDEKAMFGSRTSLNSGVAGRPSGSNTSGSISDFKKGLN
ncbi:uncharacterized protein LOC121390227 [Gigantopelta aegis]|uniref:uncharacterized protein LOC121390227 n=1 Tax=Gigantopelta aegis TaxID=1735272 RepID=UPI001B88D990|nr:uncharacterized protein LOC121390227 [Gigantopelta aegis]